MNSSTTSDFRAAFAALPEDIQLRASRAFALWTMNPRPPPSLHFKKAGQVWSVRIGAGYRAIGLLHGDTLCWFWVGTHDDYIRLVRGRQSSSTLAVSSVSSALCHLHSATCNPARYMSFVVSLVFTPLRPSALVLTQQCPRCLCG